MHTNDVRKKMALGLALALFAVSAFAAMPQFESLDANGDGQISLEEAKASDSLMAVFQTADKNQDGQLDKTEYDAVR